MTALDLPKECQYLNLRLRLEQQRLFAWSESSGLLDYDSEKNTKVLESNVFGLHRSTVLELLIQIKVLFEDFERQQKDYEGLKTMEYPDVMTTTKTGSKVSQDPLDCEKDASDALVPLPPKRKRFIEKAIKAWKTTSQEGPKRLRWAAFDKGAFEGLLQKFSMLNDNITGLLDKRLQEEIYSTTQDTNRGVLQLHQDIADLQQLVKATLVLTLKSQVPSAPPPYEASTDRKDNVSGLDLLAQLARFKAFNESIEAESALDVSASDVLQLGNPGAERVAMEIEKSCIFLKPKSSADDTESTRHEAKYEAPDGSIKHVWVEWKEYEWESQESSFPAPLIIERAQKLAALLHHRPKPKHFRVPHCLGYFDDAEHFQHTYDESLQEPPDDSNEYRIGFVFEPPEEVPPETQPISLLELLQNNPKPRVTDRIAIAKAVANSILYLHSVNWLHKGLRGHNIIFFAANDTESIDYNKPYLSGFDFARPARPGEQTEVPADNIEYNLYRHPSTQNTSLGPREAYRKSFDIYSLGVVLVELAHWKTIDRVLEIDLVASKARPRVALDVRKRLLAGKEIAAIGASMGEMYESAVWKCLKGGQELGIGDGEDETSHRQVAARLSMTFYEDVVKTLEGIRV